MERIAELIASGREVLLTHGNGPIVGNILIRNEAASDRIPPMPLDICGADSQGGIGYMLQQTLRNVLDERGLDRPVAALVTQVVVRADDPAFQNPQKPIGPFYTREQAERLAREKGWVVREDSQRGYRRVVPSPKPVEILETPVVRTLLDAGVVVIAAGGGGVPVCRDGGRLRGVEAVVDKDRASAVLATALGAERLVIVTAVDAVYRDFGTPRARPLPVLHTREAREMLEAGQFPPGSMGSKIEAALDFLEAGGREVVICQPEDIVEAIAGRRGTRIVPESRPNR